jgi:hypothetical protein
LDSAGDFAYYTVQYLWYILHSPGLCPWHAGLRQLHGRLVLSAADSVNKLAVGGLTRAHDPAAVLFYLGQLLGQFWLYVLNILQ